MSDTLLMLDFFLDQKLFLNADHKAKGATTYEEKVDYAREEAGRLKKLLGALRYLWRNGHFDLYTDANSARRKSRADLEAQDDNAGQDQEGEESGDEERDGDHAPEDNDSKEGSDSEDSGEKAGATDAESDDDDECVCEHASKSPLSPVDSQEDQEMEESESEEVDPHLIHDRDPDDVSGFDSDDSADTLMLPGGGPGDDGVRVKIPKAKGAAKASSSKKSKKASFRRGAKKGKKVQKEPKRHTGKGSPEAMEYNGYCLKELPLSARPQPNRVHRGMHSYTVKTAVRDTKGVMQDVLVDVLLRQRAYYVKKVPQGGRCGQVSWRKYGNPKSAWSVAMDQATCGGVFM
eukprot:s919_g10.t1